MAFAGQAKRSAASPRSTRGGTSNGKRSHSSAAPTSGVQALLMPRAPDAWNNILKAEPPAAEELLDTSGPQQQYINAVQLLDAADGAFVSPFASLGAAQPASYECCGNCLGALPNVDPHHAASSALWFCICCHSALPAALFPREALEVTVLRRCTACLKAAPERGAELLARLPAEIQSAVQVSKALEHVHNEVIQHDKRVGVSSRLQSAATREMQAIERAEQIWHQKRTAFDAKLSKTVRECGVATSESLFFEWVESENERVVLNTRRVVVWRDALASRKFVLSPETLELLKAAGLSSPPATQPSATLQTAPQASTTSDDRPALCHSCSFPLPLPAPVTKFDTGLCDCCERCLPLDMMKKGSNKTTVNQGKPRFCLACAKASPRILDRIPVRDGFGSHLDQLTSAVQEMMDLLELSNKTAVAQTTEYQQVAEAVDRSVAAWRKVHRHYIKVFAKGYTPVDVSRELYSQFVSHGELMGRAVATQLRLLLEAALSGTLHIHIPDQLLELAAKVYDEIELSDALRRHITKHQTAKNTKTTSMVHQAPASVAAALPFPEKTAELVATHKRPEQQTPKTVVPCLRCYASLSETRASQADLVLCDCCKRAIPETLLSKVPVGNGSMVCESCRTEHSQRCVSLESWPERPHGSRFESLPLATRDLRFRLNSSPGIEKNWSPEQLHSLTRAVRAADEAHNHRTKVLNKQHEEASSGTTLVLTAQEWYTARVKADRRVENAEMHLFRVLEGFCRKRSVAIPQRWISLFNTARPTKPVTNEVSQGSTTPRNRRRSKSKSRNSRVTNAIVVPPRPQQPVRQVPAPAPASSRPHPVKYEYAQRHGLAGNSGVLSNAGIVGVENQRYRSVSRHRDQGESAQPRSYSTHRERSPSRSSRVYARGQSRGRSHLQYRQSESRGRSRSQHFDRKQRGRSRSQHFDACSCCTSHHSLRNHRNRSRSAARSRHADHDRSYETRHDFRSQQRRHSRSPRRGSGQSSSSSCCETSRRRRSRSRSHCAGHCRSPERRYEPRRSSSRRRSPSPGRSTWHPSRESKEYVKIKDERSIDRRRSRSHERRHGYAREKSRSRDRYRARSRSRSRSMRRSYDHRSSRSRTRW